jgi:N-acetylmuramoyl-L-alanine amidase
MFANTLLSTIEEKYRIAQPGRGYDGSVSSRNLYMLKYTKPIGAYIELGNIQNPKDQVRLIESNNRQAIANWLTDGIIEYFRKK